MFKSVLFAVVFLYSIGFSHGQNAASYVQRQIDSLDLIKPETFKKVKPHGRAYLIKVQTQEDFDGINAAITKAIESGEKNIRVKIDAGVFQFHENHIIRKNESLSNVSISIVGKGTIITSDADNKRSLMTEPWLEMQYADSLIDVTDKDMKLCKIPFKNSWSNEDRARVAKVQVTQWFRANIYEVKKIDDTGIYFIAPELQWEDEYGCKGYNVNFDYLYMGKISRFRLYDKTRERQLNASRFINIVNSAYHLFSVSGICFESNKAGHPLISMTNVKAGQIMLSKCGFDCIRGEVANFSNTGNVVFADNTIRNTEGHEIRFVDNCPNVRVTGNVFENCGKAISNTFCVTCWESTYYIANNTFCDFGYAAIGVGMWHGFEKKYKSKGIIEYNEMYFTPTYFKESWKHMLMDSGAIYTWTQNDEVIIRYNYIHDYTGASENRGIFCDDGANNLKIYGNVVLNIPNNFSIDARTSKDQHEGFTNNANNFMAQNVVDNRVRFQGYEGENRHVVKGTNYILRNTDRNHLMNEFANLEMEIEDEMIDVDEIVENEKLIMKKKKIVKMKK